MNTTYTNSQDPCIPANIITEQPAVDTEDDLEAIREELIGMEKGDPGLELILMVPGLGRERTPDQLRKMKQKAMTEAAKESPGVLNLVDVFFNVVISRSAELAEKKSSRQNPREESLPAALSDKITPKQDDSISSGQ